MMFNNQIKNIGPGTLVAAAFVGPGTITLCTIAGIKFGMTLLWTLLIAVIASIFLQSIAVKIGLIGRKSIIGALKDEIESIGLKYSIIFLIFSAIIIGNTAYEAGNITGAVLGMETIFGPLNLNLRSFSINIYAIISGLFAAMLLWIGKYKIIERILIAMVILMSVSFFFTALITGPSFLNIVLGLFSFEVPEGSLLTIIGLVGTTIVPYNLFLHAELVKEKWANPNDLNFAMKDMVIALGLGGLISLSIIVTASGARALEISSLVDLALGLEPMFGSFSKYFLAIGFFAAGITSSITAPLAAAYVVCGCFNWSTDLKARHFKIIWLLIIVIGVFFSATGIKPIIIIQFAQVTNGILLPIIAGLLLWMVNKSKLLAHIKNTNLQNGIGITIVLISLFLSIRTLILVFK